MKIGSRAIQFSLNRPKTVTWLMVLATLILGALITRVHVDTDPENMLAEDEAVRLFHDQTKKEFALYDVVVLGVVNTSHPDGVFNPETLAKVHQLTEFARTAVDPKNPDYRVVPRNIMAPGNVDAIEQAGPGQVRFEWLMKEPPADREGALRVRDLAMANPLLKGSLVSEDGQALGIYLPITSKKFADKLRSLLMAEIETMDQGDDQFHITGLPVAEDTFGKEMFIQMALSAPLAMLLIFVLMYLFFRKINLIVSPMIIAMVTVICTMGALIGTGNTLHIMSSMIPIFLMPIAVVDSVHILSEFFDKYRETNDRRKTIEEVMDHLFMPMLYTSLTSSAGFFSLILTPIPPVQVFGLFVGLGILLAWFLTIFFIPSYIMLLSDKGLDNFGAENNSKSSKGLINRHLHWIGQTARSYAKPIIACNLILLGIAGYGISKININDNPVKWFHKNHEIRVADKILNDHFAGTYEAYLILENQPEAETLTTAEAWMTRQVASLTGAPHLVQEALALIADHTGQASDPTDLLGRLDEAINTRMDAVPFDDEASYDFWSEALTLLDTYHERNELFKDPAMLRYIDRLQSYLVNQGVVGKSNSVVQVVQKVHQELFEGDDSYFFIPETRAGVAQCLISFQNSHKPDDLFHLVTPDYRKANVWLQLRSGDNMDMQKVIADVERFFADNPPPSAISHNWAGLTYINVIWQDKMVSGMLKSFMGSFVVVFLMMSLLFRSPSWGLLAMVPLTVTIAFIYGVIGLIGKDYDMPVAVLSSLTLGLAVDFAIHFLERSRATYKTTQSWTRTIEIMYEEPGRAITRNTLIIALGFTPLLAAPLVPYQTVGVFLATIMFYSGLATMWILPSVLTVFQGWFLKRQN
ncbi:MAG: MMPL family transporter [Desulfobulbaceae bacterium]|uniref:MMPL family transporter n=1 Tax=Candidatus Desulfatifera sulfidica TaxID=2841691 RepID=A0A8J6TAQ7_9BACT|nr:MMPL family transporter [Candidatus Desulfatifera sulfidica]